MWQPTSWLAVGSFSSDSPSLISPLLSHGSTSQHSSLLDIFGEVSLESPIPYFDMSFFLVTRLTCLIVCVGSVWPSQQDTSLIVSIIEKIVGLDLWIFCDFLGPHNFCKTSEPAMPLMIPNFKVGLIIRCVLTPPPSLSSFFSRRVVFPVPFLFFFSFHQSWISPRSSHRHYEP